MQFNEIDSEQMTIRAGVPQGSILGPLLFLIYVNDIANVSNLFNFILFAGDMSLVSKTETLNASEINNELDKLSFWLKLNKLSLNIGKTKCLIFRSANKKAIILHYSWEILQWD